MKTLNIGKHTDESVLRERILNYLKKHETAVTSTLAYESFVGYTFKSQQGAALAISSLLRKKENEKLIMVIRGRGRGAKTWALPYSAKL